MILDAQGEPLLTVPGQVALFKTIKLMLLKTESISGFKASLENQLTDRKHRDVEVFRSVLETD
jgi:hypothetical protein